MKIGTWIGAALLGLSAADGADACGGAVISQVEVEAQGEASATRTDGSWRRAFDAAYAAAYQEAYAQAQADLDGQLAGLYLLGGLTGACWTMRIEVPRQEYKFWPLRPSYDDRSVEDEVNVTVHLPLRAVILVFGQAGAGPLPQKRGSEDSGELAR